MDVSIISILRGLIGIILILSIAFIFSEKKNNIQWKIVGIGLGAQVLLAFLILNPFNISFLDYFRLGFDFLGKNFVSILDFSKQEQNFFLDLF